MDIWTTMEGLIAESYMLVLFIWTEQGWCYLALFLAAILCLVFAVKKGSRELLAVTYAVEILPLAFSVWHCLTSDDLATILTGMASLIYIPILAITIAAHLRWRTRFKRIAAKEPDWPAAPD